MTENFVLEPHHDPTNHPSTGGYLQSIPEFEIDLVINDLAVAKIEPTGLPVDRKLK